MLLVLVLGMRVTGCIESNVFYFPSRESFTNPPGCEDVWIKTPDGKRLHGWFMRAADAAPGEVRPAVLHCHGNAGNVESHLDFSRFLTHAGMHVFIFDYRGYGRSDPARMLSRDVLLLDSLAAFDVLAARADVDRKRTGVYGVSLGAVFALSVAERHPEVAGVCTVAAFSSWRGVASDHVPIIGTLLIPGGLDPRRIVPTLGSRPYLIVHGTADEIISIRHGEILEKAASTAGVPVRVARINGADHNGILNYQESRNVIAEFFRAVLVTDGP
ncbi:MAG: alpha/beta fold hydrolase [Pyrinomonadaceae bacterium]|nr:alpha/beta fold hydrolase [Phycisphaerales bacterium]